MAKVATPDEQIPPKLMPATGMWDWNAETNELEFLSNNPNADKQDKRRRNKDGTKRTDRVTSSMGKPLGGRGKKGQHPPKSPPSFAKQKSNETNVTLDLVKEVVMQMPSVQERWSETFQEILNADEFDLFLMHLLNYFHCFFDKLVQEHKINTTTYIEPSLSEKKAFEDSLVKLASAEKLLGQAYCVLELGLNLENQHHMNCGRSRVSSTLKDRDMFETLYSFCAAFVFKSFKKKDYNIIHKEIGRILRSDTFNPANQVKKLPQGKQAISYYKIAAAIRDKKNQKFKKFRKQFIHPKNKMEDTEKGKEETTEQTKKENQPPDKMTPAEYRRMQQKRPAIKSIIHQRSPAIVAILPSPKEEAHWLFRRTGALSPNSLSKMGGDNLDEEFDEDDSEFLLNKKTFKIGIIGEPLSLFNKKTLTPEGADNEEEDGEGGEDSKKAANMDEAEVPEASSSPGKVNQG